MLIFLALCGCWGGFEDPELVMPEEEVSAVTAGPSVIYGRYPVEMCLVLAGVAPWPTLAVTLWRMAESGLDVQHELRGGEESATRCAKESITLPRERVDIGMIVHYMPRPLDRRAKTLRLRPALNPNAQIEVDSLDGRAFQFTVSTLASDRSNALVLSEQEPGG